MLKNELAQGSRLPVAVNGINVNFCKNPRCNNFGVFADTKSQPRGPGAKERGSDSYRIHSNINARGETVPVLECELCKQKPPIKSNHGVVEEMNRMLAYLDEIPRGCTDSKCPNHLVDVKAGKTYYQSFGATKSGSQRYRCKLCETTFSIGLSTKQQREPHKNVQVFRLLVNKMPLKRISEAADISMPSLYDKIDFIHRQCVAFAGSRERQLLEGMPIKRLYLAVDRQDYLINWTDTKDKRNVILTSVGSADNTTGYVFGMHLNFDPVMDRNQVESDALKINDHDLRKPYRKYARLWLRDDYAEALSQPAHYGRYHGASLDSEIESAYQEAVNRDDVEVSEVLDGTMKLPASGMQVHSDYTLYGHFFFLKKLLPSVEKVRFFMDQESGIRAACIGAFYDDIRQGRCDAFYVRINKLLTVDGEEEGTR